MLPPTPTALALQHVDDGTLSQPEHTRERGLASQTLLSLPKRGGRCWRTALYEEAVNHTARGWAVNARACGCTHAGDSTWPRSTTPAPSAASSTATEVLREGDARSLDARPAAGARDRGELQRRTYRRSPRKRGSRPRPRPPPRPARVTPPLTTALISPLLPTPTHAPPPPIRPRRKTSQRPTLKHLTHSVIGGGTGRPAITWSPLSTVHLSSL